MLRIGPACRIFGFRPELVLALTLIAPIFVKHDAEAVLSHGIDGTHSTNSLHYTGSAVDIVFTSPVQHHTKLAVFQAIQWVLGADFDTLFEDAGKPNEHLHIEFQPHTGY